MNKGRSGKVNKAVMAEAARRATVGMTANGVVKPEPPSIIRLYYITSKRAA